MKEKSAWEENFEGCSGGSSRLEVLFKFLIFLIWSLCLSTIF